MFTTNTQSPFNINGYISHLFANVRDENKYYWSRNIDIARQIATLVTNCATNHNFHDYNLITQTINRFIFYSDNQTQIPDMEKLSSALTSKNNAEYYQEKSAPILDALQQCNSDALLFHFLAEKNPIIKKELENNFQLLIKINFDFVFLPDYMGILRLLHQPEIISFYFDKLENELQIYAHGLSTTINFPIRYPDGKYLLPISYENPHKGHKILSGYLYQWAHDQGFTQNAKIIKQLSKEQFFSVLQKSIFFKDNASNIGDTHGVWSHALQWYCIIEHHIHTDFLLHPPLETYKQLGDARQLNPDDYVIWDVLFDQYEIETFTSPEYITKLLLEPQSKHRWPLLAESIARVENKISTRFGSRSEFTLNQMNKNMLDETSEPIIFRVS